MDLHANSIWPVINHANQANINRVVLHAYSTWQKIHMQAIRYNIELVLVLLLFEAVNYVTQKREGFKMTRRICQDRIVRIYFYNTMKKVAPFCITCHVSWLPWLARRIIKFDSIKCMSKNYQIRYKGCRLWNMGIHRRVKLWKLNSV